MIVWEQTINPGVRAVCNYQDGSFTVTVDYYGDSLSESFPCVHEPRFGIDTFDMDRMIEIAERLTDRLEAEGE